MGNNITVQTSQPNDGFVPRILNFLAPTIANDLVRVGRKNDGGYVLPRYLLAEANFLLSMGVNDDWSFEEHFLSQNPQITIHAYDHTISKNFFRKQIISSFIEVARRRMKLSQLGEQIRVLRSYGSFFSEKAIHFRERVNNRLDAEGDANFPKIFDRINSNSVFLKMDIEGSEYRLIDEIVDHSNRIIGMVIEFHDTDPLRPVFVNAVKKLMTAYEIVHTHANNYGSICADGLPEVLEITFVKKHRYDSHQKRRELPIPGLDHPNDPSKSDYRMRFDMKS